MSNLHRDGGEWVAAYGNPAISRPRDSSEVNPRDIGGIEDDPPPKGIPPEVLSKLAREAAEWDLAALLEKRFPPSHRALALLAYAVVLGGVAVGAWFVPCLKLPEDSPLGEYLQADCLPMSSFILWMVLLLAGFTYVSIWTCGRDNPLRGRSRSFYDVLVLVPVGAVLFFMGPVRTIVSSTKSDVAGADFTRDLFDMNNHQAIMGILYNCIFYVLPFLLGLQYSYLDRTHVFARLGTKLSLGYILHLRRGDLGVFVLLLLLFAPFVGFHLWLLYTEDWYVMVLFLLGYTIVVLLIYLINVIGLWRDSFRLSPHHYVLALMLIPWTAFFNPISAFLQALLAGIFTEGVARCSFSRLLRSLKHDRMMMLYLEWVKHDHSMFLMDYDKELINSEILL